MKYELIIVPPNYKEKSPTLVSHSRCIACLEDDVELIEEFLNVSGMPFTKTDFESIFSICPNCGMGELQLVDAQVDFAGPIWIGWE